MDQEISVLVKLRNLLSRPARDAEGDVDDLRDSVEELDAELAANETKTKRSTKASDALRRAMGKQRQETDKTTKSGSRYNAWLKSMDEQNKKTSASTQRGAKVLEFFGKVVRSLKFSAAATGVVFLANGISALGAASFASVAALAPLVGVVGAIPALIAPLLTMLGLLKLGFSDIGDALKVTTDPTSTFEKIHDALAGLTPEARAFVLQLTALKKQTDGWKDSIQAAALPGFSQGLRDLVPLLPVIGAGLEQDAKAVGGLGGAIGTELTSRSLQFQNIFSRNARLIDHDLKPGLVAVIGIVMDFLVAGGPLAERFAGWLSKSAVNIAAMVDAGTASGGLTAFLQRAGDLAASLGSFVGDVSVALYNTGKAAGYFGAQMGSSIGDAAKRWRDWTGTVEGQNAIVAWYNDAKPAMDELGRTVVILGHLFSGFTNNADFAVLVKEINDQLLPAIQDFAEGAASQLGPAIIDLLTAFVKFESFLSYSPMADLLSGIATTANVLVTALTMLPGPLKYILATIALATIAFNGLQVILPFVAGALAPLGLLFTETAAGVALYTEGATGAAIASGAATGAMVGLGAAMDALIANPVLLGVAAVAAGLGVLINVLHNHSKANSDDKATMDALTGSFDTQTGAITDNTRAMVAKKLQDKGVLDAAAKLGINLATVTDATMGNVDAQKQLNAELDTLIKAGGGGSAGSRIEDMSQSFDDATVHAMDLANSAQLVKGQLYGGWTWVNGVNTNLTGLAGTFATAQGNAEQLAAATHGVAGAASAAMSPTTGFGTASAKSADALERQAAAAEHAKAKIKELNDYFISQQRTLIGFRQSIDDSTATLSKNARTLDINTQAGRDNRSALLDVAEAAAGVKNAADRQKAIAEATKFIKNWADESGMGAKQAQNYADKMFKLKGAAEALPPEAKVDVKVDGLDPAIAKLTGPGGLLSALNAIHPTYQTTITTIKKTQSGVTTSVTDPKSVGGATDVQARRDGGAVWSGEPFVVGEVGPELLINAEGLSMVGTGGQETRSFAGDGFILPADDPRTLAYASARSAGDDSRSSASDEPVPDIHNHFHGDSSGLTAEDVEQASLRAWRKFEQERKERK